MFMAHTIRERIYSSNTPAWLPQSNALTHTHVMNKPTEFGERLVVLMKLRGLTQYSLAKASGVPQPTIQRLITGETRNPKVETLRQLASTLNATETLELKDPVMGLQDVEKKLPAADPTLVDIPQFDQGARMGNGGLVLQDQPGMIRRWEVSRDWLSQNVKGVTPGSQLCIVTGFGDSMKPMFNPGDPLLVDLSVRTVEYDAVYFFRVSDEGFIKRIQRIPGQGLKAISANRDHYEPWTITEDMDFEVLGRVLKVWKGDDF